MCDKLQIVLVDDLRLFREGIEHLLQAEPDIEVIGQGESAGEAIHLTRELRPDLILINIEIPDSLYAVQSIAATCPETKIVILTLSIGEDNLIAALKADAQFYIPIGVSARELIYILRLVQAEADYITPGLAARLLMDSVRLVKLKRLR